MMSTSRFCVALVACCVACAVPLSAHEVTAPVSIDASARFTALMPAVPAAVEVTVDPEVKALPPVVCETVPDYVGPEYFWYMRAMLTLDCVNAIASRELELADPKGEAHSGVVTVPRELLERIRELTMTAKDAAARIGR